MCVFRFWNSLARIVLWIGGFTLAGGELDYSSRLISGGFAVKGMRIKNCCRGKVITCE